MTVPDTPYTRKEKYLDAIANGDASGIPEKPYTREEMYLDAIARNGGGGGGGGSGGGVFVVHSSDDDTPVLDKTWKEIKDAWDNGAIVVVVTVYNDIAYLATVPSQVGDGFALNIFGNGFSDYYVASSENGYPEWRMI